jgi:signal transduction histidine kinase/ActR/RegA family two-component response regulator
MSRQRFARPYKLTIIALGAAVSLYSAWHLPFAELDLRFLLLAFITITISSRITVTIPRTSSHITVFDTFLFLAILLYSGEAAVLLAAVEALCSSLRVTKRDIPIKPLTIVFNPAMMACSTFLTVWTLRLLFGDPRELLHGPFSAIFIIALCLMALVQYVANSGLASIHTAFKTNEPVWHTWSKYYLWSSVTYFAGVSAAGIIAKITDVAGFYALIAMTPIIAIIYFTYRTYLNNIEVVATAAKAEAEAAARAEASAAQAEQARRHVEELSHYIAEQERIREQYTQIEKMSALGELASGVAHDFNNTLAGILGRAQLLLSTKDPHKIEAGLKIIIKTAKDGAKTIKRIQDFARQRRDHDFQPVSVDQLLLDVSEITRPRWKDRAEAANVHIRLDLQICSNLVVMGDESELREVLVNMVFNAVDAMPQGGRITLSAEEINGQVEISVRDTGTGMSEEVRSRVFDPFFTTKGKTGMGLGLAVSYGIVRRHEGTVEVESEVERGTTFCIKLPAARGIATVRTSTTGELTAPIALPAQSNHTRILVVDDELAVRELLQDILEQEGYEVVLAEGGHEALSFFEQLRFDAIFTDVGLPGMSGWEFAQRVRERNCIIPIAVITGWGEAVGSSEQRAAGVDWVVAKPFTVEQIIGMAQEVGYRREGALTEAASVAAA